MLLVVSHLDKYFLILADLNEIRIVCYEFFNYQRISFKLFWA